MNLSAATRTRRPTPFELAAVVPHEVRESKPDWKNGLLMTLGAVLALGWIDANDNRAHERELAAQAEQRAAQWQSQAEAIERAPTIRLEGEGYVCRNFNIQREWTAVMATECQRLAGLLRTARATE